MEGVPVVYLYMDSQNDHYDPVFRRDQNLEGEYNVKKRTRLTAMFLAFVLSISLAAPFAAATEADTGSGSVSDALLTYRANSNSEFAAEVKTQVIDEQIYLFLPSSANLKELALTFAGDVCTVTANGTRLAVKSGEAFDFEALFPTVPEDGKYNAKFLIDGITYNICIMCSGNVRSLYITSSDAEKDHAYVDAKKGNKAKNNEIVLLTSAGACVYEGVMKEIKGRGNSTWNAPKKPYQFKLNEKVDLLDAGSSEAAKTWILLANYADDALFRNRLTNDLAAALKLNYAHNCEFVDLYYDGEYCGTYLLSEKTEIGDSRIDIRDLESEIEDVNGEDVAFDDLPVATVLNKYDNPMQVVEGIELPENYTGGYLLELDYESRAKAETSWFKTTNGQYVVCKSPEYLPVEAMDYVSELFQEFEDAVFNGGVNPTTGKSYTEYVDLESLAKSYLLLVLSQNGDAFLSSTFFYIPENERKLYAGPVWDFDTAYGLYLGSKDDEFIPARSKMVLKLLLIESFRDAVIEQWDNCLRDVVQETVLNTSEQYTSNGVSSIGQYGAMCGLSQKMDAVRWGRTGSYSDSVAEMYSFMEKSYNWVETVLTNPETKWATSGFIDVKADAWYENSVIYVTEKGYFSGLSDSIFFPGGQMTRAMLVTVLYRMAGKPAVTGTSSYSDVAGNSWYSDAVVWAETAGITKGYGNGKFGVDDTVSREQLVVFLYRFAQLTNETVSPVDIPGEYGDAAHVALWARDAFGWAISKEIINGVGGYDTPMLAPQQTATRAETAVMIQRYDENA